MVHQDYKVFKDFKGPPVHQEFLVPRELEEAQVRLVRLVHRVLKAALVELVPLDLLELLERQEMWAQQEYLDQVVFPVFKAALVQ